MSLSQTTITGSFKTPKGDAAAITGVTFKLKGSDYEAGEQIVIAAVEADAIDTINGTFSATLWPNDRGSRGNTTYSVTFTFSDGSAVTPINDLYVRHSDSAMTMEDLDVQARIAGAIKPLALVVMRRSRFDPNATLDPNAIYLILED